MGSKERRLKRLEAFYGDGEPSIPNVVLDGAFDRLGEEKMDHLYGAFARDAFGDSAHISLVDPPRDLGLMSEEVEALEHLREALEEELS
jgi:hypothetical protein